MLWIKRGSRSDLQMIKSIGGAATALLFLVLIIGNSVGTGVSLREAWCAIGVYTLIVGVVGAIGLSTSRADGGPLRFVPWVFIPFVTGCTVAALVLAGSEYTAARARAILLAAVIASCIGGILFATARRRFKRPNQSPEPTTPTGR